MSNAASRDAPPGRWFFVSADGPLLFLSDVKKLRVGVIFGGRSGEHEVSIASAAAIFKNLDPARYEAVPIKIAKDGRWALTGDTPTALSAADVHRQGATEALVAVDPSAALQDSHIDVVFPVLHGPYGEDGTVQGLLELANVPYVGAGVLGSAVGMDKAVMKALFAAANLPIVPHLTVLRRDWERDTAGITRAVAGDLRYPVFVKPANLGSSVGISKATSDASLADAMTLALDFDRKVVIEAGVPDAREIECAVLGNDDPEASVPGEIIVTHADGFYSYAAKYLDPNRSEEHTSELQSRLHLVCRLLLEKKNIQTKNSRASRPKTLFHVDPYIYTYYSYECQNLSF